MNAPRAQVVDPAMHIAVRRLREAAPVERVVLFGSRARGDHSQESDWDLCVLLDDDVPPGRYTPSVLWRAVREVGIAIQVVPMRRSVFERRRSDINALAYDIAREGIVLYDRVAEQAR